MRKVAFLFAAVALAVASAKSYSITLTNAASLGNAMMRPGQYEVKLVNDKAVISGEGFHSEAAVKVENNGSKYSDTTVVVSNEGGTRRIHEIHLGGTTTKLILSE